MITISFVATILTICLTFLINLAGSMGHKLLSGFIVTNISPGRGHSLTRVGSGDVESVV